MTEQAYTIVRDRILLSRRSSDAKTEDRPIAEALRRTLLANEERCVGMAANMIGFNKRIIAFFEDGKCTVLLNPVLLKKEGPYEAEEGCLSLDGTRKVRRYQKIRVAFETEQFEKRVKTYSGFTAQIVQHEMDHLEGILI